MKPKLPSFQTSSKKALTRARRCLESMMFLSGDDGHVADEARRLDAVAGEDVFGGADAGERGAQEAATERRPVAGEKEAAQGRDDVGPQARLLVGAEVPAVLRAAVVAREALERERRRRLAEQQRFAQPG